MYQLLRQKKSRRIDLNQAPNICSICTSGNRSGLHGHDLICPAGSHLADHGLHSHIALTGPGSVRLIHVEGTRANRYFEMQKSEVAVDSSPILKDFHTRGTYKLRHAQSNGATLRITHNCMTTLHRLRSMGDLTLWIDGTCIDQSCTAERSAQVALMRDIYLQAAEVVVRLAWGRRLGEQKGHWWLRRQLRLVHRRGAHAEMTPSLDGLPGEEGLR